MDMQPTLFTDPPSPAAPEPAERAHDWPLALVERQLAVLGRLAEAGLEVALAIERQAKGESDAPVISGDLALAYARVARAVRLTIALQSQSIRELRVAEEKQAEDREAQAEERKDRAHRIVHRIASAQTDDAEAVERVIAEADERLDDDDLCGDVLNRPLSEVVADICQALGLAPDWWTLAEEAWAREEMASGDVGAPLVQLGRRPEDIWRSRLQTEPPFPFNHEGHEEHQGEPCALRDLPS